MINNTFTANNSAFTYGGNEYRNLEAQVKKNQEDIAKHYAIDRVLADFGIRVIGQVDTAEELPDPETYEGEYGDAFAVGSSEPYDFYIWTRPNVDGGNPNPYWFNIGELAIVGPQGPEGPEGPIGPKGEATVIHNGTNPPARNSAVKNVPNGDYYINTTTGDLYKKTNNTWTNISNIKGPEGAQGPQGPQGIQGKQGPQGLVGPQGTPGKSVHIIGIIDNVNQLPEAATTDYSHAYLVRQYENTDAYKLYIINSYNTSTGTTYYWQDAGFFNSGTVVLQNGSAVSVFDADNYLKAPANLDTKNFVVLARYSNALGTIAYGQNAVSGYLVQRTTNGTIRLPNHISYSPAYDEAVSAGYVQDYVSIFEDGIQTSPERSPQKVILNASSNNYRNLTSLAQSNSIWINSAELLIYFPGEQGYIMFGRSDATSAETDIQFRYDWYPTTECKFAYMSITYDYDSGEQILTFRSGDGKSAYTDTFPDTVDINYLLWDQVSGTSVPYIEEIKFYQTRTTINTDAKPNQFSYPN